MLWHSENDSRWYIKHSIFCYSQYILWGRRETFFYTVYVYSIHTYTMYSMYTKLYTYSHLPYGTWLTYNVYNLYIIQCIRTFYIQCYLICDFIIFVGYYTGDFWVIGIQHTCSVYLVKINGMFIRIIYYNRIIW